MNRQQIVRKVIENPTIRIVSYPAFVMKHNVLGIEYRKSEYSGMIKKIRNINYGKRCFIIGNGPSLTIQDLNTLHYNNEICFAMNRIYDLFEKTKWRPDYYFCYDRDFIRSEYKTIIEIDARKIFIDYSKIPKKARKEDSKIYYYFTDYVFSVIRGRGITNSFCENLSEKASFVTDTTQLCIEFAVYMGIKDIYLLGVDHDYSFGYGKNHAIGIKEGKHNDEKKYCTMDMDTSTKKYEIIREYADKHGINIMNATRGGKLDVFKKCCFEELFDNLWKDI